MTFRLLLTFALLLLPMTGHAADCVKVVERPDEQGRQSAYASVIGSACGSLKVVDRRRQDPRPGVDIRATYVMFDPAQGEAEHRYNKWIGKQAERINFAGELFLTPAGNATDTMTTVLYRSPRLLSAESLNVICCGAHGSQDSNTLNIDSRTGRNVELASLVDIDAAASACADDSSRWRASRGAYVTAESLKSSRWSVRASGLRFDFGFIHGYADGYFVCEIKVGDLRKLAKPGVAIPF